MTDVVKVTSKGQITLPVDIRNALDINDASYLVVEQVGDYVLMKKAEIRMKEIQAILKNEAKRKNISKKDLLKALEKSEKRTWTS
jgi:antitoxin PrlF